MKKISLMSLLLLFIAVMSSCSDPTLNDWITEFNNRCPEDMGGGMTMKSMNVVDDYVQLECISDESELALDNSLFQAMLPSLAEPIKEEFLNESDMKALFQCCSDEGKGFRMMLTGEKSGASVALIELSPQELNEKYPPRPKE
ncbi:MAG: hypothetical protein IKW85_05600 [Muribaculaceae bacterium]|nr:hypothetical protein [Muribaculaceae bacterium]